MSLFSAIKSLEHTFAGWFIKTSTMLYHEEPKIETAIEAVLKYAGPVLQMVVTAEAGAPAGAMVGKVISEVQVDLPVAASLIYDCGPNPSASSMFKATKDNLGALLTAGHITNPASVDKVTKVINNITGLTDALAALPAPAPTAPAPAK